SMATSHFPVFSRVQREPPPFDLRRAYADAGRDSRLVSIAEVNLRGTAVAPVPSFVKRHFGPVGWNSFLAGLDGESRSIIEQPIIATNWYSYSCCRAYIDGLVTLANGRTAVLREFAMHNLDY